MNSRNEKKVIVKDKYNNALLEEFDEARVEKEYKKHSIIKERVRLYKDFTLNLTYYIYDSYLGNEYIKTNDDKLGHFKWCFNKVCDMYLAEGIDFKSNKRIYYYFIEYFKNVLYNEEYKINQLGGEYTYWSLIFQVYGKKNKAFLDVMINLYKIFDETIENKLTK
jgi:hypothetical protein